MLRWLAPLSLGSEGIPDELCPSTPKQLVRGGDLLRRARRDRSRTASMIVSNDDTGQRWDAAQASSSKGIRPGGGD